jgi:hypothetical protein
MHSWKSRKVVNLATLPKRNNAENLEKLN